LLPVWGDEDFTLLTASQPVAGVLKTAAQEKNNPPLHSLLVHYWLLLPWPAPKAAASRALSALTALAATVVIDRLFLKGLDVRARLWFLALWAVSPCLLLCARIGRSYSLQVLVFACALGAAARLLEEPGNKRRSLLYGAWNALLLYVHYLSGTALAAGVTCLLAWRAFRLRRSKELAAGGLSLGLVVLLYLPWLPHFREALGRMAGAQPPPAAAGAAWSGIIRLGYLGFSFVLGETPPSWVMACAPVALSGAAYLAWRGARPAPRWLAPAALAAVAAYWAAGRWVSFVFIPARVLFLLPFALMLVASGGVRSPRAGRLICTLILCLSGGSITSYFRRVDFLNKAYVLSYDEIAGTIRRNSGETRAVLVADTWNTDPYPLANRLGRNFPMIPVGRSDTRDSVRAAVERSGAQVVWYFRNTHDTSAGGLNRQLERELSDGRAVARHLFVPYQARDRRLMRLLGWREIPSHFIQLLEIRPEAGGGAGSAWSAPRPDGSRGLHLQVVGHGEDVRNARRRHAGDLLVHLAGHHAFQRHVAVVYDDADWSHGPHVVAEQRGGPVDRPQLGPSDLVVEGRQRQNLDLVLHRLHPGDALDHGLRRVL